LHHARRRQYRFGSLAERLVKGGLGIRDMDGERAARRFGRLCRANPATSPVGIREQVVLPAIRHRKRRPECPAQHFRAPRLRCRGVRAGKFGVCDPPVKPARRHMARRRGTRVFSWRRLRRPFSRGPCSCLLHGFWNWDKRSSSIRTNDAPGARMRRNLRRSGDVDIAPREQSPTVGR
jgi:hypothetical protein